MTKEECVQAAKLRVPVICNDIKYRRISAVIFRYTDENDRIGMNRNVPKEFVEVELEDLHTNSRTITNPRGVELA